jgi:hypothetical protein
MKNLLEEVALFIGGQVAIEREFPIEAGFSESILRGEIKDISLDDNKLVVQLNWVAKLSKKNPEKEVWINDPNCKKIEFEVVKHDNFYCFCGEDNFFQKCFFNTRKNEILHLFLKDNPDNLKVSDVKTLKINN